ncbi:MAG: prolyl oligopeptidase family serine peptidase [Candidatus Eremiobacteraeota bacterium]|nr:prolyl oligopeptidase family serine peptidase [Candidatus Eremiobacteraeota bacterium]
MVQKIVIALLCLLSLPAGARASSSYRLPPPDIVKLIDAPVPPRVSVSPDGANLILIERTLYPPLELFARPVRPLAGMKIEPAKWCLQRLTLYHGLSLVDAGTGKTTRIKLPAGSNIDVPRWAPQGGSFAFTRDGEKGLELWIGSLPEGKIRKIEGITLTNITGSPFKWERDGIHMLLRLVPGSSGPPPPEPLVPESPVTEETQGRVAKVKTYQNLIKSSYDEKLFDYYGKCQPALLDTATGKIAAVGGPGIYLDISLSPDGSYLHVTRLEKPYSRKVPFSMFACSEEIWDREGKVLKVIARIPIQEEVPPDGVPEGPREITWQPFCKARLIWVEALDGGDPQRRVPFREKVVSFEAPFTGTPSTLFTIKDRFTSLAFLKEKNRAIVTSFDRAKRWTTTHLVEMSTGFPFGEPLFSRNFNDDYHDPGSPVNEVTGGEWCVAQDGSTIYLAGKGATPEGEMPFLSACMLPRGEQKPLFRSRDKAYESFIAFYRGARDTILIRSEDVDTPPNFYLLNLKSGERKKLTDYVDPTPELRSITKELVKYKRADGVELSGTLFLPPGYEKKRGPLPLVIWAYPLEYTDSSVAGQVRGSPYQFSLYTGPSHLLFLTRGYAVLSNAAMPVVGDPETKNNNFIEQIVQSAKAAIDCLASRGIADPSKVMVGGHSYGAFMTANLLAHSRLFAAGIARSGAYNRTLTPFGFQNERRSFWEAPEVYIKMSPFTYADKIKDPLLIIHGEDDDNSGTFPMQSERLYDAIKGNGGTARLVLLPLESHAYGARESVLHVIAEMLDWGERHGKR